MQTLLDKTLASQGCVFDRVYAEGGRGSVPLEQLVWTLVLHSIRSERLLKEQFDYNLLSGWSVELLIDEPL